MSEDSFIDAATVRQFVADLGPETATNLMRFFIDDASARVERIRAAQQAGDWSSVEREVHSLGSSAGTQGALQLMDASRAVEAALRNGRTEEAARDLAPVYELAEVSFVALGEVADRIESGGQPS